MTENEAVREMTFEEEYEILQKEKKELFSMEDENSETPFANCVVRRALRCIRKLLEEIQQYRAIEYDLKERYHANVDIKLLMHHFIETVFEGEKHEGFCLLTNEDADMWNAYKAIGTIEELQALKEKSEPYKPKEYEDRYYACKCNNILLPKWRKYPTELMPKSEGLPHCMACGQKLDWE